MGRWAAVRWAAALMWAVALCFFAASGAAPARAADEAGGNRVNIYLFWGEGCPHCAKAKPVLESIDSASDKVTLYKYEIYNNAFNQRLFQEVGEALGEDTSGVPFIVIGDKTFVGYSDEYADGIRARVDECKKDGCPDSVAEVVGVESSGTGDGDGGDGDNDGDTAKKTGEIALPILGTVNVKDFSLPALTVVIAVLDGFNPCAMWVLLFLISALLGMENRRRMWLLGGSFIAASAVVYFLFMTAWLNIFMFIGYVQWLKALIGVFALGAGSYYLYDFWKNKSGGCKVVGGEKRRVIFEKVRRITRQQSLWLAVVGIIGLAFAVNMIELVCSAGLPAIYTSVLADAALPAWQHYSYLLLYTLVFMADDLFVFFVAMVTLQVTGIQSKYARYAHLVGGVLMLAIGSLLIFAPQVLMFG